MGGYKSLIESRAYQSTCKALGLRNSDTCLSHDEKNKRTFLARAASIFKHMRGTCILHADCFHAREGICLTRAKHVPTYTEDGIDKIELF